MNRRVGQINSWWWAGESPERKEDDGAERKEKSNGVRCDFLSAGPHDALSDFRLLTENLKYWECRILLHRFSHSRSTTPPRPAFIHAS